MQKNITPKNIEQINKSAQTHVDRNGNLKNVHQKNESNITVCINKYIVNKAKTEDQFMDFTHRFEKLSLTPSDLLTEIAVNGYAFCSAVLEEGDYGFCHKKEENFIGSWLLAIDIDNTVKVKENGKMVDRKKTKEEGYYSYAAAVKDPYVVQNASSIYTTATHTNDLNKFRILFSVENEIKDKDKYKKVIKSLNKLFDGDPATVSAAQGFYGSKNSKYKYFGNRFSDEMINQLLLPLEDVETDDKLKDFESEGFEVSKFKDEDIDEINKFIFKNGNISNDHWWRVPTILHNSFGLNEDEIVNIISSYTEVGDTREKVRYAKRYSNSFGIGTLIWLAQKNGYKLPNHLRGKNYKPKFWNTTAIEDDKGVIIDYRYKTNDYDYEKFLNTNGYYNYIQNNKSFPIEVVDRIVYDTSVDKIRNFSIKYLETNQDLFSDRKEENVVKNGFSRDASRLMKNSPKNLPIINDSDVDIFKRDEENKSFIYYKNGFNEITESTVRFRKYEDLDGYVHYNSINKREYSSSDNQKSIIEKFVSFLSTERLEDGKTEFDSTKFKALSSILGYLTSTFKKKELAKAIVLTDRNPLSSDKNEGGTGKSLFANIIKNVRNLTAIDGRNLNFDSEFKFNQINYATEVCLINDCSDNFKFDNFYNAITDDLSIRQLHKGTFNIPFEKSPKFILTTNSVIPGNGSSDRRRKLEIEVSNYFNQKCTPADKLGRLFDSWDDSEWNRFDDFIVKCVQLYLQEGLIESVPKNIDLTRLQSGTCETFAKYAINFLKQDELYWYDSVKNDYESFLGEIVTPHTFTKYLNEWCIYKGCKMYDEYLKNENNRRVLVFTEETSYNMNYWKASKEFKILKLSPDTFPSKL